ncbi:MAG TPA: NHL repeat-containing protein [Chthonomonadaceae bacterium]|nr:NHL repeat-containing protein [Chthonomonadaceae bacterium]
MRRRHFSLIALLLLILLVSGLGWPLYAAPAQNGNGTRADHPSVPVGPIFYTDSENNCLVRIDDMTGKNKVTYGTEGKGIGQFSYPEGICTDRKGRIYIADTLNNRVVRIDDMKGKNWITVSKIPDSTTVTGYQEIGGPDNVYVDSHDRIYVVGNDRVVRMADMTAKKWEILGGFFFAQAVCTDRQGHIYIADRAHCQIVRVDDMKGNHYKVLKTPCGPQSISIDSQQRLWIAALDSDHTNTVTTILRVDDITGRNRLSATTNIYGDQKTYRVRHICLGKEEGSIYMLDEGNSRLVYVNALTGEGWSTLKACETGSIFVR